MRKAVDVTVAQEDLEVGQHFTDADNLPTMAGTQETTR